MTVQITRGSEFTAPPLTPLASSILDHATVTENTGSFGLRNNEGLYPSYTSLPIAKDADLDCEDTSAITFTEGAEWVAAVDFVLEAGVRCKAVGLDAAQQEQGLREFFEATEGRAVEEALISRRFKTPGTTDPWDAPVEVASGMGLLPHMALAALEGALASQYPFTATIFMPRAMLSMLNERIIWQGEQAFTRSGNRVVASGALDSDTPNGVWTMWGTGAVRIERSESIALGSTVVPGDGAHGDFVQDNDVLTLAERLYRVAVDGPVIKVETTLWQGPETFPEEG